MMQGLDALKAKLNQIVIGGKAIAVRSLASGLKVMESAAASSSPGTIGREVGSRIVSVDDKGAHGIVGLGVGRGSKAPRPHGRFLTKGTKRIAARHFIANSLESSTSGAFAAMLRRARQELIRLSK